MRHVRRRADAVKSRQAQYLHRQSLQRLRAMCEPLPVIVMPAERGFAVRALAGGVLFTGRFQLVATYLAGYAHGHDQALQWFPIDTAPQDGRLVIVYAAAKEGLPGFKTVCRYHADAGWCVDEIREVTHWLPGVPDAPGEPAF